MPPAEESAVLVAGPWRHRTISANGARFHLAEAGDGPLVVLLHGFPQFWWTWRHQLVALSDAGYHVVAPDLRGYGASDKPPRGYDAVTLAADVAGLVRALGERDAFVVGHDWGGLLAWTVATLHPQVTRRLAVLGMAHPLRLRAALLQDPRGQLRASRHLFTFQPPRYAEWLLSSPHSTYVDRLMHAWAGPQWTGRDDFAAAVLRYQEAMRIPGVAHSALEYHRWLMRSSFRPDGWRYAKEMGRPVAAPTLQLHGAQDQVVLPRTAQGSGRYVAAAYEWRVLIDAGHFPHEESPDAVNAELLRWAKHE
jgi:pimeloyl-ACP methyl ester carboxylesterase